jgi:putative endonuclease
MIGKGGAVYVMTNENQTTLYVGVTSDLITRITQHKEKFYKSSFSARYNLSKLVYYETFHSIDEAIQREKQLKAGSRKKKVDLVNSINPEWNDLFPGILEQW